MIGDNLARISHRKRRELKYGKYAVQFNSLYLFSGLYLLGGKYIPGVNEEDLVSSDIAYNRVRNHFSSFIKDETLTDEINCEGITSKVFIGTFRFFESLFIPLVSGSTNSPQKAEFYDVGALENMKLNLIVDHNYSEEKAERELVDKFIQSTLNPLGDSKFFNYMQNLKSNYINSGDKKSKKRYMAITEYITFKKIVPTENERWPSKYIFNNQILFSEIKKHPVSKKDLIEICNSLGEKDEEKQNELLTNSVTFLYQYYSVYYYFFKSLNALDTNLMKKILCDINLCYSQRYLITSSPSESDDKDYINEALGCESTAPTLWSEIKKEIIWPDPIKIPFEKQK